MRSATPARARITSYNVCYTKLLRVILWLSRSRLGKALRAVRDDAEAADMMGVNVTRVRPGAADARRTSSPARARITSYNVCYTKLLRVILGFGVYHTHFEWPGPHDADCWVDPLAYLDDLIEGRILIEDRKKGGKWIGSSSFFRKDASEISQVKEDGDAPTRP